MNERNVKKVILSPPIGTWLSLNWATSVVGTFTYERRRGRWIQAIRTLRPTRGGWRNNIGLKNPGLVTFDMALKFSKLDKIPTIFSVHGRDTEEWRLIHAWLMKLGIMDIIIELNLSCPNVVCDKVDPNVFYLFAKDFPNTIVKLPPQYDNGFSIFQSAYNHSGINSFHCCNTLPTERGGESGSALKPHSLKLIEALRNYDEDICVIGGGGIYTPQDVIDYHNAGANKLSLATIFFTPWKVPPVKRKIQELYNDEEVRA